MPRTIMHYHVCARIWANQKSRTITYHHVPACTGKIFLGFFFCKMAIWWNVKPRSDLTRTKNQKFLSILGRFFSEKFFSTKNSIIFPKKDPFWPYLSWVGSRNHDKLTPYQHVPAHTSTYQITYQHVPPELFQARTWWNPWGSLLAGKVARWIKCGPNVLCFPSFIGCLYVV